MPNFSAIDILTLNILEVFLYVLELDKKRDSQHQHFLVNILQKHFYVSDEDLALKLVTNCWIMSSVSPMQHGT